MPILRDIPISLSADQVMEAQGRIGSQAALVEATETALALGSTLWSPAVAYEQLEVLGVEGKTVSVAPPAHMERKPHQLLVGPKADLLAPAHQVMAAVYTIGPALGARVSELVHEGEHLLSYVLDCVGVMALGVVGESVRRMAEEMATAACWGVGAALSPGSLVGWSIRGQRELCAVLPIGDIGVSLNKYGILEPHKSGSVVIGLGPGFGSHEVGSVCVYCSLRDTCWRRKGGEV
jgi:hypothetical protein